MPKAAQIRESVARPIPELWDVLLGTGGQDALDTVEAVTDLPGVRAALSAVRRVHRSTAVADYVIDLVTATRDDPSVLLGASPRAGLDLIRAAQAQAVLSGRTFVNPDDVKAMFHALKDRG